MCLNGSDEEEEEENNNNNNYQSPVSRGKTNIQKYKQLKRGMGRNPYCTEHWEAY